MVDDLLLPVYSVDGDNYEIGYQIGKKFKTQIADVLGKNKRLKSLKESEKKNSRLQKLVEYGKRCFSRYMQEIRGVAEGSGSSLTDILLRNFYYDYPREGCTTVIFKESDRIILAHNEDNSKDNLNNCYLLKIHPEDGTPFISLCYAGMIPGNSLAFNVYGIVISNDAMLTPDIRIGCPRHLAHRWGLEAKNMRDAIERVLFKERASGGSINIASQKGKKAVNIETTSLKHCITEIGDRHLHANHHISPELGYLKEDIPILKSSISRQAVGDRLLSKVREKTPQAALDIMSSLENTPYSILRTDERVGSITLFTALFDVDYYRGVTLKVYEPKPNMRVEDAFLELTLDDLKN